MISFKQLEAFLENATLNLVIKKTETGIVISVLPKPNIEDKAKENLIPLILKGTAEELDAEFITLISTQLEKTTGIITNIAEFEANAKEMKNKSEAAKKEKEAKKKANEKAEKELEKVQEYIDAKEFDKATFQVNKALKISETNKKALAFQKEIEKLNPATDQVDIFDVIEETESKPQVEGKSTPTHIVDDVPVVKEAIPPVQETVTIQEVHETVVSKMQEKQEAGELGLDEISDPAPQPQATIQEIADASPNINIVTMPETPKYEATYPDGRPKREDMEPMDNFEARLAKFETNRADNPEAVQPTATPVEEPKSPMQEMAEQEMADKQKAFEERKGLDTPEGEGNLQTLG